MVSSVQNQVNTYTATAQGGKAMDKEAFLELMIAQLQNQDPMNPMDGTEYAAQLAQFTSLEQLTNLNDSMDASIDANYYLTQSINNTMTATLIGKDVKLTSTTLQNIGQDDISFGYKLPVDVKTVTIKIYNESGALIKTIEQENNSAGEHKLSWDFSDNNGTKVPNGKYTFKVTATDAKGEDLAISTFGLGTIDGVRFSESGTALLVDGVEYSLADVMEILNNTSQGGGK
ncbi:MAG: flagellar hook capping protein [Bacteroidetes bacterium]|nr:flagellar hook capping protein [Bacteroidota bacterium]MBU1115148.1 flagellar hook capping protein [Bacteroidota bacterium]MBU1799319.1 flagellar hook capping protein [Bacteroidota bacterium]